MPFSCSKSAMVYTFSFGRDKRKRRISFMIRGLRLRGRGLQVGRLDIGSYGCFEKIEEIFSQLF